MGPPQKARSLAPWPWIHSLQNCEKINVCCLKHRVCGTLLQQPRQTNAGSIFIAPSTISFSRTSPLHILPYFLMSVQPLHSGGWAWSLPQETFWSNSSKWIQCSSWMEFWCIHLSLLPDLSLGKSCYFHFNKNLTWRSPELSRSSSHLDLGVWEAVDVWEGPDAQGSLPGSSNITQLEKLINMQRLPKKYAVLTPASTYWSKSSVDTLVHRTKMDRKMWKCGLANNRPSWRVGHTWNCVQKIALVFSRIREEINIIHHLSNS